MKRCDKRRPKTSNSTGTIQIYQKKLNTYADEQKTINVNLF